MAGLSAPPVTLGKLAVFVSRSCYNPNIPFNCHNTENCGWLWSHNLNHKCRFWRASDGRDRCLQGLCDLFCLFGQRTQQGCLQIWVHNDTTNALKVQCPITLIALWQKKTKKTKCVWFECFPSAYFWTPFLWVSASHGTTLWMDEIILKLIGTCGPGSLVINGICHLPKIISLSEPKTGCRNNFQLLPVLI